MKHFPFILSTAVALALSACGNSQSSSSADDTVSEDSIPAIIEEVKAEHHEDEGKVIADLNFFINEKDFDKNKDKYLADIRNEHLMQYNIGNYPLRTILFTTSSSKVSPLILTITRLA